MAIDPNWVRENPEEAARQIDLLTKERDQYRAAEEAQIALREKAEQRVEELKALCNTAGDEIIKAGKSFLELDGRIEFLNKQNTAQQEQNDELAAYVEEAKKLVQELAAYTGSNRVYRWLEKETPSISLARRELIKQAELLEEAYKNTEDAAAQDWLYDKAEELRRKAEEAQS